MKQVKTEIRDFENIKLEIQNVYGEKIKYAKQCKELSKAIERNTGRLVSTATLRRFFQLMKSNSNPSRYTLETLSLFIDSEKSRSEIDQSNLEGYERTKKYCDYLVSTSRSYIHVVEELLNKNYTRVSLYPKLRYLLEFAVEEEKSELILSFYQNSKALTAQTDFYKIFGAIVNSNPEKSLKTLAELAKNEVVRLNFFENFVNTGNFKVYQQWLKFYKNHEENPQKILWADAILIWGQILSKNDIDWQSFIISFNDLFSEENETHPMLKARVYGVALFCPELKEEAQNNVRALLINEGKQFKIDHAFTPFATLLLTQYLLLADQKELLRKASENLNQSTFSTEYIIKSFPFFTKLINAYLSDKYVFEFDEVLMFQSGFTNEDYLLKAFALRFLNERDEESIADYVESIMVNNNFWLLSDISRGEFKGQEVFLNFG